MKHLERLIRKNLGEILVDEGLISKPQLVDAEQEQRKTGAPLGSIMVTANFVDSFDLAKTVCAQYQLPYVDLAAIGRSNEVEGIVSEQDCQFHRILPIDKIGSVLTLAVAEMPDGAFLKELQERTGLTPFLFVAQISQIADIVDPKPVAPDPNDISTELTPMSAEVPAREAPAEETPDELVGSIGKSDWEEGLSVLDVDVSPSEEDSGSVEDEAAEFFSKIEDGGTDWENIFDEGNQSVLKEIDGE